MLRLHSMSSSFQVVSESHLFYSIWCNRSLVFTNMVLLSHDLSYHFCQVTFLMLTIYKITKKSRFNYLRVHRYVKLSGESENNSYKNCTNNIWLTNLALNQHFSRFLHFFYIFYHKGSKSVKKMRKSWKMLVLSYMLVFTYICNAF